MESSKVLVIGGTGYIGRHVVYASAKHHPTFALVRETAPSDPAKADLLKSFEAAGVTLLHGDLTDHVSLVAALKQVDVVISTVGGPQILNQVKILDAIMEARNIRRFLPSEFGNDVDRLDRDVPVTATLYERKVQIRRAVEKSGVPYTYIQSGASAGCYLAPIAQDSIAPPRDGKLTIYGDGNVKAIFTDEVDIGTFTVKSIDDPRAENKRLHIRLKENILSQNEIAALWEKKIGHTFQKENLGKDEILKAIGVLPFPRNMFLGLKYSIFVKGDQTSFTLDPAIDVDATELYSDVKYTTADEYLTRLV